jgi:hypothetical protein
MSRQFPESKAFGDLRVEGPVVRGRAPRFESRVELRRGHRVLRIRVGRRRGWRPRLGVERSAPHGARALSKIVQISTTPPRNAQCQRQDTTPVATPQAHRGFRPYPPPTLLPTNKKPSTRRPRAEHTRRRGVVLGRGRGLRGYPSWKTRELPKDRNGFFSAKNFKPRQSQQLLASLRRAQSRLRLTRSPWQTTTTWRSPRFRFRRRCVLLFLSGRGQRARQTGTDADAREISNLISSRGERFLTSLPSSLLPVAVRVCHPPRGDARGAQG